MYAARDPHLRHHPADAAPAHALLAQETGLDLWVKHENHNPTSAFKVRGGLNLVRSLTADERARGVVTASTGNHGQSIALAWQLEGVACTVFVPDGNNPEKNAAMRAFGATVDEGGRDFDEARERCEQAATRDRRALRALGQRAAADCRRRDLRARDLRGAAGRRRHSRADRRRQRRLRQLPRAHRRSGPTTRVIGVQAAKADAFARSWRSKDARRRASRRHVCRGHGDARHVRSARSGFSSASSTIS